MWDPWAEARASEELRGRLKWFLLGRVAVISCFLGIVAFSYLSSGQERYVVSVNRLFLIIAATYGFSLVSAILLPRLKRLYSFTYLQVIFDVLLITGVIYFTGGIDSPFAFLYSLPIINSAVLLFAPGALVTALLAAVAYDALLLGLDGGTLTSVPAYALSGAQFDPQIGLRLATTNSTFVLIALLAGILTRRMHALEMLLQERQAERDRLALLRDTLARTIGSTLITTDADGYVTSFDATAEELTGLRGEDIAGTDIGTIFAPLRLTASARLRFLQSPGALEPTELAHRRDNGDTLHLRCSAAPLRDTFGHLIGALYVLQNITSLKRLEDQPLREDLDQLCTGDLDQATELAEAADGLYGASPGIHRIRDMVGRVASSDATVLITGESGTGKEVVARAIHARGPRHDKRFVAINCGAIPEYLIESELFGHVRGAFTGAVSDRPGCIRAADGGTLLLDEIGDLPLHLQVKLLRVLQERVFRPVGSETSVAVDVRIIAASNRNLRALVGAGKFREDLFYRLDVVTIELPPLRERREDIPLLIRHFLRQFSELHQRRVSRFSVTAGRILLGHDYPGNIRELENAVEHAVALCEEDTATEEHLPSYLFSEPEQVAEARQGGTGGKEERPRASWAPPAPLTRVSSPVDLEHDLAEYEKTILLRALDKAGGVKKRAAELLGINYRSLRHRLQKYGLSDVGEVPPGVN